MVYAVIADIHGNYPALRAVLEDAKRAGAQQYLFVGDYITDLPYTREIYEMLREWKDAVFVSGNREWYMDSLDPALRRREQFVVLFLTRRALGEDGLKWVKGLPHSVKIRTPDGKKTIFMEHICDELYNGTQRDGVPKLSPGPLASSFADRNASRGEVNAFAERAIRANMELESLKKRVDADIVIHGHTHMQYAVNVDAVTYINPGSCGMPLDHQTGAPYTLLRYEDGMFSVEERRVPYDMERTVEEWRNSPFYREADIWCDLGIWQVLTARDYNHLFFQILAEEQKKAQPGTVEEHNQVFRRAFRLTRQRSGQLGQSEGVDKKEPL